MGRGHGHYPSFEHPLTVQGPCPRSPLHDSLLRLRCSLYPLTPDSLLQEFHWTLPKQDHRPLLLAVVGQGVGTICHFISQRERMGSKCMCVGVCMCVYT